MKIFYTPNIFMANEFWSQIKLVWTSFKICYCIHWLTEIHMFHPFSRVDHIWYDGESTQVQWWWPRLDSVLSLKKVRSSSYMYIYIKKKKVENVGSKQTYRKRLNKCDFILGSGQAFHAPWRLDMHPNQYPLICVEIHNIWCVYLFCTYK